MSERSELYYKECREKSVGAYYKNYCEEMRKRAIAFDNNYKDMEFFRKHIPKHIPFSYPQHIREISDILNSKKGKEVYIIKADGHIQKARIDCVMKEHYRRKVFDIKRREYFTINHQLRKILGIYNTKGNTLWEYLDWGTENPCDIHMNREKIMELIELNKKK